MREIKFRYTCKCDNGHVFSQIFTLEQIEVGDAVKWIEANFVDRSSQLHRDEHTEFHDKNNVEIYEGDWLKWNNNFFWIIYDTFNGCWYGEPHIDNPLIGILVARTFPESEVYGNICENPGLLEVK